MTNKTSIKLTRRQVAAVLAISEAEVRSKDNEILHPTKGSDGSWVYAAEEVGFVARGGDSPANVPPTGATCAMAFELFAAGKSMSEVVIALKQQPAAVRTLRAEYDSMVGCLTLSKATVMLLEKASRSSVRDEQQLLDLIGGLRRECEAAYQEGYSDAGDWGEVLDPRTGKMKPLNPNGVAVERGTESPEPKHDGENERRVKTSTS